MPNKKSYHNITNNFPLHSSQVRNSRNKDKPLLRKKSDLPQDSSVTIALNTYKRADDYLKTSPNDGNKC